MNATLSRVPAYWLNHATGYPKTQPINLTVSATFDCNSKCTTCGIWKTEGESELTAQEFEKIFIAMDDVYWLTISGGEPLLRKDLVDIIDSAYHFLHPKIINIPTNALAPETAKKIGQIARFCPDATVVANVSIDGVGKDDDEIRGVPGAYDAAVKTLQKLKQLREKNLVVGVHTVVSKHNVSQLDRIYDAVMRFSPDSYVTEVAEERVELNNIGAEITPSPGEYTIAKQFLLHEMGERKVSGLPKITRAFRRQYYQITERVLREKQQVIPCYAAIASGHITPYGDVWACCVRAESLGNLRDFDYDFKKIWASPKAERMRKSIKNKECACPLANAHYTSMLADPKTLAKVLWSVIK